MNLPAFLFNQSAEFDATAYPQDAAGGEVPTPANVATLVPCCVQQDAGPTPRQPGDGQKRRGSDADVRVFFRPSGPPSALVVAALKVNDRFAVAGRTFVLDGPAFDVAGRGVVWEARAREAR